MILAIETNIETKICPRCKLEKTINEFSNNKSKNGRSKWCIPCKRKYEKEYRERNAEKIRKSVEIRRDKYNSARMAIYHSDKEKNREKIREWYHNNTKSRLWSSAKNRAKKNNLDFNICKEDIVIPKYCPVLGIELKVGTGSAHDASPSLDRIIPYKGYVCGNIIVVSHKANSIKNNATVYELKKVYEFYKDLIKGDE